MKKMKLILIALLVLCSSKPLFAQTITRDIGGTIADSSGAVVVGAKVVVTNIATNVKTTTTTP